VGHVYVVSAYNNKQRYSEDSIGIFPKFDLTGLDDYVSVGIHS